MVTIEAARTQWSSTQVLSGVTRLAAEGRAVTADLIALLAGVPCRRSGTGLEDLLRLMRVCAAAKGSCVERSSVEASMTERFVARRVERVRILEFEAPPALVFPLHGFREEKAWAVGWEPQPVYPADGAPGDGAVFLIRREGVEEIWVLTRWDPDARILSYVHVTPGRDVTDLRIRVTGAEDGPSRVEVAYAWTSLSDEGNAYVARQTEDDFRQWMGEWEEEMRHYLRTGRKLERPQASGGHRRGPSSALVRRRSTRLTLYP